MKRIVIFASGSGSNAENIIRHFQAGQLARVEMVLSNKPDARVLVRARDLGTSAMYFNRTALNEGKVALLLEALNPDLIVLAGFLWKIPEELTRKFKGKIINIHPALLPEYGGKGMYGMHVHQAAIKDRKEKSGITIHYVNEHYDEGAIIFQASTPVTEADTPETLATKIHELEHRHFPIVIETLLNEQ
ncbi:phosphoribosylglycinamide formyltransferase [Robertkochia flava]|uniref:phosphoribosylglycinamide formyltransferase n=1 Tax=Robertkochia flava TaxID=3447986 RepID=UPI001CCE650C|nr:phosphoribosylglycinamide formyltransferase [Robertkochia marina]